MDDVDKKIVAQLQLDGRTTVKKLAKIIGFSNMGTKKRVDKLLEGGIISVSALANTKKWGLYAALVLIEIAGAKAMHRLLDRFKECPRVVNIFTTLGGYNIIALVVAEDRETLDSISVEKCSLRSGGGIRRSEFYPIGYIHYSPFLPVREYLAHKKRNITPCGVDCRPCNRYKTEKCVGCPTTSYYRGTL
ncbi:MAG: winged helix-turn-helix transcriptional regulator [Candidatus Bathyarchaeota archaeon]|nr:winged helix-turn-helix transcriptional regulator [Candidatus Bathyarchaeota archaeon]